MRERLSVETSHEREREHNIESLRGSFFVVNGLLDESELSKLSTDEARNLAQIVERVPAEPSETAFVEIMDADFIRSVLAQTSSPDMQTMATLVLNRLALNTTARPGMREKVQYLIEAGVLSKRTLPFLLSPQFPFFNMVVNKDEKWWRTEIQTGRLDPHNINPVNWGRAIEFNDPHRTVMPASARIQQSDRAPFDPPGKAKKLRNDSTHYVLNTFLGREHLEKLGAQIEAVIPRDSAIPPREALEKLFEHYAKESPEYEGISKEKEFPPEERKENIRAVNAWQEKFLEDSGISVGERFMNDEARSHRAIDLYARVDPIEQRWGDMDQFQLAIIAKTVQWYIKNGHSHLFDRIRVVPDGRVFHSDPTMAKGAVALSALLAAPGAEVLKTKGKSYRDSFTFANRFFLTHAKAREATEYGSIPLIGWGVFWNPLKRWRIRDVLSLRAKSDQAVVFRGFFNEDDRGRRVHKPLIPPAAIKLGTAIKTRGEIPYYKADVAGDIPGLINETLRCLRELEKREIERTQKHAAA